MANEGGSKYNYSEDIKDFFREQKFEFVKYPSTKKGVFSSIEYLTSFIDKEIEFWSDLKKNLNFDGNYAVQTVDKVINHFRRIRDVLTSSENIKSTDSNFQRKSQELINRLNRLKRESFPNICSESEFANVAKSLQLDECDYMMVVGLFSGYFGDRVVSNFTNNLSKKDFFIGFIYGIRLRKSKHFKEVDESFYERSKSFISEINEQYNDYISHIEDRIVTLEDTFKQLESDNNKNVSENKEILDELKTNKKEELDNLISSKAEELEKLESLYKQKLKLSEPADYWKKTSEDYKKRGMIWSIVAGTTGLLVIAILVIILASTSVSDVWSLESVKFTVILTVIISIGLLLVNLTIKLALSNYHLAVDATERHKLTYLYLALLNESDNAVSEKEKSIVFQALFARSDSGLTKSDSGIQMPNAQQLLDISKRS